LELLRILIFPDEAYYTRRYGAITIKAYAHEINFKPFGLLDYEGSWVIVDGIHLKKRGKLVESV
jgi:hypothetical protein